METKTYQLTPEKQERKKKLLVLLKAITSSIFWPVLIKSEDHRDCARRDQTAHLQMERALLLLNTEHLGQLMCLGVSKYTIKNP